MITHLSGMVEYNAPIESHSMTTILYMHLSVLLKTKNRSTA